MPARLDVFPRPRGARLLLVAALSGVCAGACSDPSAPPTAADLAGTYLLTSVHGQSLPVPYGTGPGGTSTVAADTIALAASGAWRDVFHLGSTTDTRIGMGQVYAGTWALDASAGIVRLTQTPPHDAVLTSAYQIRGSADALTLDAGPVTPERPAGGLWVYTHAR